MNNNIVLRKIILIFMLSTIGFVNNAFAQCMEPTHPDYTALMSIYNSTDGANWTNNTGWEEGAIGTNCDPCDGTWFGITCNTSNRVHRIHMIANNLSGDFPIALTQIEALDSVNFRDNFLIGELPSEIGQLTDLRLFIMDNNQLSGEVPSEIGLLSELLVLRLNGNQFIGDFPIALTQLTNLQDLLLYENGFTGEIPPEIGLMTNLETLYIHENSFTGELPAEIGQLSSLRYIDLFFTGLSGPVPPELCDCDNLEFLYLNNNQFTGNIPDCVYELQNLRFLYLNHNEFTGQIPNSIGNLTQLTRFSVEHNSFDGPIPSTMGQLPLLRWCYLNNNEFTSNIPSELGQCVSLDSLDISNNLLTGEVPVELGQLTNLISLDISSNQLTGEIPSDLGQLSTIATLDLSNNELTGNLPFELILLANLVELRVNNNNLSGCFPEVFDNFCSYANLLSDGNPLMPWEGNFTEYCATSGSEDDQVGAPCDDGLAVTNNDVIDDNCECSGECTIFDITYEQNCEIDDELSILLDFEYAATSATFEVELDGASFGTFNYDDLPVLISPLSSSPTDVLTFNIIDSEAGCNVEFEVRELSCVWPGDANYDLVTDKYDLLNVAIAFDFSGPARIDQSISYDAKAAQSWNFNFADSLNYKHADTDGNGIVDYADTLAICQNYSQVHTKTDEIFNNFSIDDPQFYLKMPSTTLVGGELIEAEIILGSNSIPVVDFYGAAFRLEFDPGFIVENSVNISFENSWVGDANEIIHIQKEITPEIFDLAIARTDQTDIDGFGIVGVASFVLMENLEGKTSIPFEVNITQVKAITAKEAIVALNTEPETADVVSSIDDQLEVMQNVEIYPNPSSNFLQINTPYLSDTKLYNSAGELVLNAEQINDVTFDVSQLPNGVYLLLIESNNHYKQEKIIINH